MNKKPNQMIRILQSSLPPFHHMLPYLEQVETNRCHSNFGKLFRQFEHRMGEFFGCSSQEIGLFCNGTMALVAALKSFEIPFGRYCLMPSWTFSATPAAAAMIGLVPYFLDVDLQKQHLMAKKILDSLERGTLKREEIGAVIAVCPFGAPLPAQEWDEFTKKTKIPVIIDAAAGFDAVHRHPLMKIGDTPIMISLHATKIFGIGEGGMLLSKDQSFIEQTEGISNFGFTASRLSSFVGMNAKMSEYQAAIGLGVLDCWSEIKEKRLKVTQSYLDMFQRLGVACWLSTDWLTSMCSAILPGYAEPLRDYLIAQQIESRIWWEKGCHTHPAYGSMPKEGELPNTALLGSAMLGLPFSIDTSETEIQLIESHITHFLEQHSLQSVISF